MPKQTPLDYRLESWDRNRPMPSDTDKVSPKSYETTYNNMRYRVVRFRRQDKDGSIYSVYKVYKYYSSRGGWQLYFSDYLLGPYAAASVIRGRLRG